MFKIKTAAAWLVVLILAFSAGNSAFAVGLSEKSDIAAYYELTAPAEAAPTPEPPTVSEPTLSPEPELTPAPEPTLAPEPVPTPTSEPEPEPKPKPRPKPITKPITFPPPDDAIIYLPVIPRDAPAPRQIKRLPRSGMVCLTFDDGYSRSSIKKILKCLRENDVQCTFFVIGACLKRYPDLWRQAVADGHEIAYHTMNHYSLNRKTNRQIVNDMNKWIVLAHRILGEDYRIPRIARAPGGSASKRVRRLFCCIGYNLIYWSSDTFTGVYRRSRRNYATRIAAYIMKKTKTGSISLQHFNKYDAASVSLYIKKLKEKFILGRVSDALQAYGIGL